MDVKSTDAKIVGNDNQILKVNSMETAYQPVWWKEAFQLNTEKKGRPEEDIDIDSATLYRYSDQISSLALYALGPDSDEPSYDFSYLNALSSTESYDRRLQKRKRIIMAVKKRTVLVALVCTIVTEFEILMLPVKALTPSISQQEIVRTSLNELRLQDVTDIGVSRYAPNSEMGCSAREKTGAV